MRFFGLAVVTGAALVLGACGDKTAATPSGDTANAAVPAAGAAATGGVAMAPITGTTHEVKMVGDASGYHYDPAEITIKAGDGIKYVMVSGGPHNVAFDPATLPEAAKAQLTANMTETMGELSSKFLINANEEYTLSYAGVPAGTYDYFCTPHIAMNMRGKVTIQ